MAETTQPKEQLYTMLDVAKIVSCSKSTVYRTVKENHLRAKRTRGQAKLYDETLIKLTRDKITAGIESREPNQRNGLETLKKQLEIKDGEIERLQNQLEIAQQNLARALKIQEEQAERLKILDNRTKQHRKWWK